MPSARISVRAGARDGPQQHSQQRHAVPCRPGVQPPAQDNPDDLGGHQRQQGHRRYRQPSPQRMVQHLYAKSRAQPTADISQYMRHGGHCTVRARRFQQSGCRGQRRKPLGGRFAKRWRAWTTPAWS